MVKRNKAIILLSLFSVFFLNCSQNTIVKEHITAEYIEDSRLIGEWTGIGISGNVSIIFTKENKFKQRHGNETVFLGEYTMNRQLDSLYILRQDSLIGKYKTIFLNDSLFLIQEKTDTLIGELCLFHKKEDIFRQTQQYIIPDNVYGDIFVNYPKPGNGQKGLMGMLSPTVNIYIGESRLTQSIYEVNPLSYITDNMEFYWQPYSDLSRQRIPCFKFDDYLQNEEKYWNLDEKELNSVYVSVYGFNRVDKVILEKQFKQNIKNDILWFRIDTLKNLLTAGIPETFSILTDTLPVYKGIVVYGSTKKSSENIE